MHLPGRAGGETGPTVVFEGGLTAGRPYWAPVQAALADVAPTVVDDRSGLGRGPAAARPGRARRVGPPVAAVSAA
ncbi:hypothetical protein ACFC3O_33285 [Streptomyces sp. NPDC056007]|uniref:hypothetical protein n=1 Tax=Streptomyces sp. NPDC056007 TaxID=3345678 RepID=UPI0035DA9183